MTGDGQAHCENDNNLILGKKDLSKGSAFVKPIKEQTNECSKVPFE